MKSLNRKGVLVVGCGSIGQRHLQNLRVLGIGPLWVYDSNPERTRKTGMQWDAAPVGTLQEGLENHPLAAFICTPPRYHMDAALQAVQEGCHLFVEKPLSHDLEKVDPLLSEVAARELVGAVGFNLRFHPALQCLKKILEEGRIGRLLSARLQCGQYLPDWHPWEDYRQGYSANQALGGGILLDTHEFDYLTWLAGNPREISCMSDRVGDLETDTEDVAEINFRLDCGVLANLHVDYLQRSYQRRYEFHGTEGSLVWDFFDGVKIYDADQRRWEKIWENSSFDTNLTYLEEIKNFFLSIDHGISPEVSLHRGKQILEWTLAAKESSETGKSIHIPAVAEVAS